MQFMLNLPEVGNRRFWTCIASIAATARRGISAQRRTTVK